jgi:4-oxalocrotonate tautomerase
MPIVNVNIMEGRSEEKIKVLIENVTLAVSESLDVPSERVRVLVTEVPKTHWGIGGTTAEEIKNRS